MIDFFKSGLDVCDEDYAKMANTHKILNLQPWSDLCSSFQGYNHPFVSDVPSIYVRHHLIV